MKRHLLIRAALGEELERVPVWAMRQAGRWDPEFNRLRAGLSFYEFSENVELAAKTSLLPRRFGVDAIILFYDITTLPIAMGLPFTLQPGRGPVPDRAIQSLQDVERLEARPDPRTFCHITDLLRRVQEELKGELPVIVFAGAPFTVATYCIGTGKDVGATRAFAKEQPEVWEQLLQRLEQATIHFLQTLFQNGADVYQLFDSWAGALAPEEYRSWAQARHQAIFRSATGVPRILFVKDGPYLEAMATSGADVVSLGKRHDLAAARKQFPQLVFQGNVDEGLLTSGTPDDVAQATRRCLDAGGGQRHILNLSHGVDPKTPVANFEAYVRTAQE
ncbi:MAG: uroporphyrinogen decarboxylase [Gemmataceae bacterium]|nr:uroporphyrinogen decarboxylase [Gemmataceae bacterium]MCI0739247.1 uroporphyrinogen decarboxylase [Gemmataceae bacterium]